MDRLQQARLEEDPLLQAAAEWFFELRADNVTGERIAEWQLWLAADGANREAFERIEQLWRLSDKASVRWPSEAEVARDEYSGAESVSAWNGRREPARPRTEERRFGARLHRPRARVALIGIAAALAAGALLLGYWPLISVALQGGSRITIETGVGETRTLRLPDGSLVSASGETLLVATLLRHSRNVVLERGEAFFRAARDVNRPFTVRAGDTTVTDIGTAFDVRRSLGAVVVAVSEGVVSVSTPPLKEAANSAAPPGRSGEARPLATVRLEAGERLTLEPFEASPELTSVNPTLVAAWQEGRLHYVDEPLDAVVADLARYSTRRIVITDPNVARLRVTGVVLVQNIDGWLASLQATFPIRVVTEADGSAAVMAR